MVHNSSTQKNLLGTVIAVQANFYLVSLGHGDSITGVTPLSLGENENVAQYRGLGQQPTLLCTRPTRLKKIGQQVMVGDRVLVNDAGDNRGVITKVFPRQSMLERPPVANANQILLLFAVCEPDLDITQLSRFLVKAESTGLEVCLVLNKTDLISVQAQEQWRERINQWGYDPVFVSVEQQKGLNGLLSHLNQKITVLAGPSGVGKSSLINVLIPQVRVRVARVSGKLQKGRHTTRHVELFELPGRGLLADTPGFNQPDLHVEPQALAFYFPEARDILQQCECKFNDCLHRDEPDCVVRGNWERYPLYLEFLAEAIAYQQTINRTKDTESSLKVKVKSDGQLSYEPKLETKKYRRRSRKEKHQTLHELYDHQTLEEIYREQ